MTPDAITMTTPWDRPPLTANQRMHWAPKAELTRFVRNWARRSFANVTFEKHPIVVEMTWYVGDRRRRDSDNAVSTLKPLADGLVDAGVVPDDTPEYMDKRMPQIVYRPGQPAQIVLTVRSGK